MKYCLLLMLVLLLPAFPMHKGVYSLYYVCYVRRYPFSQATIAVAVALPGATRRMRNVRASAKGL